MKILVVLVSLMSLVLAQAPSKECQTYHDMLDGCYVAYDGYDSNSYYYEAFKDGKKLCCSHYINGRLTGSWFCANDCEKKGLR